MNFKRLFLISSLAASSVIQGFGYEIELLEGAMLDKHPLKVFIISDEHGSSEVNPSQQKKLIEAILKLGKKCTKVLIEDNKYYTGTSRKIQDKLAKARDEEYINPQLICFLTERCKAAGIDADTVDNYRYHRYNKSTVRELRCELLQAQREVDNYNDDPRLQEIYKEHLSRDFKSAATEHVMRTAQHHETRETRLDDAFFDRFIAKPLKRRGFMREVKIKGTTEHVLVPPSVDHTDLQQMLTYQAPSHEEQLVHNERLDKEIRKRISKINEFTDITRQVQEDAEEKQEDFITYTATKILNVKCLHEMYNLSPNITNVVICVGGEHASYISNILRNKLNFKSRFKRSNDDKSAISSDPIDISLFFHHYFENTLEKLFSDLKDASCALATPALKAELLKQFGSPLVRSTFVASCIRTLRRQLGVPHSLAAKADVALPLSGQKRKADAS